MKKVRVGIIGTGFGAKVHAPMMSEHPGFEVVSIASVSRGEKETIMAETGISSFYSSWEEMLKQENLDLVSITSVPLLHHEMVLKAYENRFHVLCEKPMAMQEKQAKEMIFARDKANRYGFINFEFRFLPVRLKIKQIMDSGKLGRILHIHYRGINKGYERAFKRKYWLGQREQGGGMLGALGSHMLDAITWWKNEDIASVYGQLPIHFPEYIDENGNKEIRTAEDSFQVIGDFKDGTTFNMEFISSNRNTSGWRLEVHGTNGTLIMTDDQRLELALMDESLKVVPIQSEEIMKDKFNDYAKRYADAFMPMLDNLYLALTENLVDQNLATFEDGLRVQGIMDGIRKSEAEGRKIIL